MKLLIAVRASRESADDAGIGSPDDCRHPPCLLPAGSLSLVNRPRPGLPLITCAAEMMKGLQVMFSR